MAYLDNENFEVTETPEKIDWDCTAVISTLDTVYYKFGATPPDEHTKWMTLCPGTQIPGATVPIWVRSASGSIIIDLQKAE